MKRTIRTSIPAVVCACLLVSCGERRDVPAENPGTEAPAGQSTAEGLVFGDWHSKAELQMLLEGLQPGMFFSVIEGRNHDGLHQYRVVIQPFSDADHDMWATYWGLNENQFYETELMLLRQGFRRKHLQAFPDATQGTLHQLVYVRPSGSKPQGEPMPDPSLTSAETGQPDATGTAPGEASETQPVTEPDVPDTGATPDEPSPKATVIYSVVAGDTLSRIAVKYKVPVAAIKAENNLRSDMLRVGQNLKIPAAR